MSRSLAEPAAASAGSVAPSFDAAVAFAQDLIRIPSLPGEEGELVRRVVAEMEALGYDEVWTDELGNVVGVVKGSEDRSALSVMLSAHLDMVAAGDESEWEHPPFDGVIADGHLHGRGAMDIKGPLALQTHVGAALKGKAAGDVIVAHPVFEERGGWGMDHLTRPNGGLRPAAVIIGESTNGDVAIGHRGRAEIEITVRGLAGHASAPGRAQNALDALPAVLAGVDDLARRQGKDPMLGPASVVATGVDATPASLNVVPDRVTVTLDWRILPSDTEDALLARVRKAVQPRLDQDGRGWGMAECRLATERQRAYTGVEEERSILSPGFCMDPKHPVVQAAAQAVGRRNEAADRRSEAADQRSDKEGEPGRPARVRPWIFATDGGWTCGVRGIPTIGFAPGLERHAHTNTERLNLDDARWAYGRYLALVPAVQAALAAG